jgi:hypothetical protein
MENASRERHQWGVKWSVSTEKEDRPSPVSAVIYLALVVKIYFYEVSRQYHIKIKWNVGYINRGVL